MSVFDTFRKNKEKKEVHTTPPPSGHTLAEMLQDKHKSDLFGELLKRDGHDELAEKVATGKLDEGDINLLEEKRKLFSEKLLAVEKVGKMLTRENVIQLARNNPEFEKFLNLAGPEKTMRAIQSQLKDIAISDEGRFNTMVALVEKYNDTKEGECKEVDNEVEKLLKENKISSKEYSDAIAIDDPLKKDEALRKLASKIPGGWEKAKKWISVGKFGGHGTFNQDTFDALLKAEGSLEDASKQLDLQAENIGAVLALSLSENKNIKEAFFGELLNEKAPEKPKVGLKEAKEKGSLDEAQYKKDWEKLKYESGYDERPEDQERIRDMFTNEQKQAYREKKGSSIWEIIFAELTEKLIEDKKATLQ